MKDHWLLTLIKRLEETFRGDREAEGALALLREKAKTKLHEGEITPQDSSRYGLPAEIKNDENHFALFSDGACRGNPGPGAWAAIGQNGEGEILFELSGLDTNTTNNRMELEGAISALKKLQHWRMDGQGRSELGPIKVYLYSDSRYVVDGVEKWLPGWKAKGWKKADNKTPENLDYWQDMDRLLSEFPPRSLSFVWVKGHAGHPQNERCDQLANLALDEAGF